jgi:hypothetical protein
LQKKPGYPGFFYNLAQLFLHLDCPENEQVTTLAKDLF